jgi:hypothetical protein
MHDTVVQRYYRLFDYLMKVDIFNWLLLETLVFHWHYKLF